MVRHMNKLGIDQSELSTLVKLNAEKLKRDVSRVIKKCIEIEM